MMAQETHKQKFMLPKSQLPSDDDIDDDISENNRIVLTKADDVDNCKFSCIVRFLEIDGLFVVSFLTNMYFCL